ncbi:MAG: DUF2461 domain-containing protein [Pseudarcicella sp.]|nr:DUF2461 domain-containing protein [Pseudarcicella sp.]MBP6410317.1 DUF2461 domain-containing protein [Pseudarcicella sp.]
MKISENTLDFCRKLAQNNAREWFHANKIAYQQTKNNFEEFIQEMILRIGEFENMYGVEIKHCNYRIARDVRFSADKSPYKTWLSASFSEGGRKANLMDYYLHIQPDGKSFLGGGAYAPSPQQLAQLRQEIDYNALELKSIIQKPIFKQTFGDIQGSSLKTSPKGYDKEHPEIQLIRMQQMFFMKTYTDQEVLSVDFATILTNDCKVLKPFLDYLNVIFKENTDKFV